MKKIICGFLLIVLTSAFAFAETFISVCDRGDIGELIRQSTGAESCSHVSQEKMSEVEHIIICGNDWTRGLCMGAAVRIKKIEKISPHAFAGLTSLKSLVFIHSSTSEIATNAFSDLNSLEELIIIGPAGSSDASASLSTIIRPHAFQGLINLKRINISQLKLELLDHNLFQGLHSLETIILTQNQLTQIQKGTFKGLPNLREINLSYNYELKNIEAGSFEDVPTLKNLYLGYVELLPMTKDFLKGLSLYNFVYGTTSSSFEFSCSEAGLSFAGKNSVFSYYGKLKDCGQVKQIFWL